MDALQRAQTEQLIQFWQAGYRPGRRFFPAGPHNRITDVDGLYVGHVTLNQGECQTGVTAIKAGENLFSAPLPCGAAVLNGFAKPAGLIQIEELGVLETPIILTNTLSVGRAFSGCVRDAIRHNPELGRELATVNPLVLECNDGFLNDIQAMQVSEEHVLQALDHAQVDFARGSVGAGRGMSCFSLKGGIGTSSCKIPELNNATLGVLVLANFGNLSSFMLDGVPMGDAIAAQLPQLTPQVDAGSIIIVMATDLPLSARQLKRVAKRAGAGLGRLGSYWGHGSGDIAVALATKTPDGEMADSALEPLLRAAAEGTEMAVLDALLQATPVIGFRGHQRVTLTQALDALANKIKG